MRCHDADKDSDGVICSGKESVNEKELETLGEMLWYADMAYEGESERTLHERLMKKGAPALSSPPFADAFRARLPFGMHLLCML